MRKSLITIFSLPVEHECDGFPGAAVLFAGRTEHGALLVDLVNEDDVLRLLLDLPDVERPGPHHHLDPLGLRLAPVHSQGLHSGAVIACTIRYSSTLTPPPPPPLPAELT